MTLFEKYGGVPTVTRIVSRFYREILARPTLKPYFEGVDTRRLIDHQVQFISHVLGQPASVYEGRTLGAAHGRLNITAEAFSEVAEILQHTLREAGMEAADIETVMGQVAGARPVIVSH